MDGITLDLTLGLWLVAPEEQPHGGDQPGRYAEAGAAQKIFYEPLSITHDLRLEAAFETLGKGAPTVDEAYAMFQSVAREVDRYAFEADGEIWHIRNRSRPVWEDDPLVGRRWVLLLRTHASEATARVELEGSEVATALAWLPLLDGRHGEAEITDAAKETAAGARVLAALESIGALILLPEEPFAPYELPELLFMSHSSVFIRGDDASILIDPAILTSTELLAHERVGRRPFQIASSVDAVIVSHHHWDHLSFQTMLRVPRTTPIYVPRATRSTLANPPLKTYLTAFGFEDVREVGDWEHASIGDIEVTFVPFFGEPFGLDSRFDAFTYLVRTNGKTIYGSLDACHDEAGNMDPVMRRLGEEGAIDVFLFGSSAQRHDPLYRGAFMRHYSNELVRRPDLVRYHPDVDDVLRWCGPLRPKAVIPYANFVYFGAPLEDVHLDPGRSNVDAYWASLGERAPAYARPWRDALERFAKSAPAPLVMLHPLQGLRLGSLA
jgi:L-ascorbate metabolism protein UlaG (beta-lactamase superfamily)